MEQAPLISIIMPVYNAGVLLHTAVESVLRQSFADFELLLVDDGSTDGSAALAHELAKKDGRIRVLEQPNAGICAARNLGLQHRRAPHPPRLIWQGPAGFPMHGAAWYHHHHKR